MTRRKKLSDEERKRITAAADAVGMEQVRRIASQLLEAHRAAVRRSLLIKLGSRKTSSTEH
jgi:hypothetical protein